MLSETDKVMRGDEKHDMGENVTLILLHLLSENDTENARLEQQVIELRRELSECKAAEPIVKYSSVPVSRSPVSRDTGALDTEAALDTELIPTRVGVIRQCVQKLH